MDSVIGILGIFVGVIIAIIPYLRSKYYLRPRLTIELEFDGGSSFQRGLSHKNDFSNGYVDSDTAIRIYELKWEFKIFVRNNSDLIAFFPEIEFNPNGPRFTQIDNLNKLQPIKPAESLALKAEFKKYEESTGSTRTKVGKSLPTEFNNLGILIGYENAKKKRFYTVYNHNLTTNKNSFLRDKPRDYKNN